MRPLPRSASPRPRSDYRRLSPPPPSRPPRPGRARTSTPFRGVTTTAAKLDTVQAHRLRCHPNNPSRLSSDVESLLLSLTCQFLLPEALTRHRATCQTRLNKILFRACEHPARPQIFSIQIICPGSTGEATRRVPELSDHQLPVSLSSNDRRSWSAVSWAITPSSTACRTACRTAPDNPLAPSSWNDLV